MENLLNVHIRDSVPVRIKASSSSLEQPHFIYLGSRPRTTSHLQLSTVEKIEDYREV